MKESKRGVASHLTCCVACFVLSALFSVTALGQTFGEVTGRVADPSGASVPGATMTLTNVATNATRATVTTSEGFYTFPSVPPGIYNVKAEHQGFKVLTSNNVEVQVQQSVRLDLTLEVGQVSQTVEVSASSTLLQAENATVGTVISNQSITELPLNGREYLNLVALSSNVNTLSPAAGQAGSRQGGDRAAQAISTGGNRIFFDYYTLDGVNNTDFDFNTYVVLPSIDAIQEFKVQTGVYPAEFGHEASQINVLTKSGGNTYHASLFEFNRNQDYAALAYQFTAAKPIAPAFNWNDYGYELDGPVMIPKLFNGTNKLFFMSNFETLSQRQTTVGTYSLPTAAMQQGNYSAYPVTIYQPNSGGVPFPNNIIPASMINPISQKLLTYPGAYALPNTGAPNAITNNYTQNVSDPFNRDMFVIRMDYVESAKSQWAGRYSWCSEVQKNGSIGITGTKVTTGCEQYLGSNTRILSPNIVNEARFGHTRIFNAISTADAFSDNAVAAIGIPNLNPGAPVTWGIPEPTFSGDGFTGVGDGSDDPYQIADNTTQAVDNLSWIKGKHTFKFGGEYERDNYDSLGNQFLRGQFTFQPNATENPAKPAGTGDAFAEFLLGDIYQSTVAYQDAVANYQRNDFAIYADDTWKITSKLTLTAGVRWEVIPPFTDLLGNLFTIAQPAILDMSNAPTNIEPYFIRQGNCTNAYAGNPPNNPPITFTWSETPAVCNNGLENNAFDKTRWNDIAPRVGIAYSPDSKTVVRVAYGTFFMQDNANSMYFDMARNVGVRPTLTETTLGTTWGPGSGELTGLPATWANAVTPSGSGTGPSFGPPYGYINQYNHLTSYTEQYLVNLQRQLSANWAIEVGYLGSESHHLYGFQNTNQGPGGNPVGSSISHLPWPNDFGVIQMVADGINADYNALSFKITKRFSKGLSVVSNYTWSKSIDDSSGIRVQGYDTLFPQNSYCLECERGLSAFNVPQRFVTSVIYDIPVGKGRMLNINNGFLDAIIGGWQTGGTWTWQAGVPVNLTIGGVDNSLTDEAYDRPNYISGQALYASNQAAGAGGGWYNRNAFIEAPTGYFGDVGRNPVSAPAIFGLDGFLHKNFTMPYNEHHQLQLRFEAFNILNHPVWGEPNPNILAGAAIPGAPNGAARAGFGVITSTAIAMRQIQLGAKYTF
ncbi:MAG TPA: carboxypeptidase regulatory-like domain-containing protein [Bryobacteraceae bacterium]|nr:carboxypeptidase regulatory-like domain-containing protein [Bryobacteraceae bacterium]